MLFYSFFAVIIAGSILGIALIVRRKLPQLTLINPESLPSERDAQKKKEIIGSRITRMLIERWRGVASSAAPAVGKFRGAFLRVYGKVQEIDSELRGETVEPAEREESAEEVVAAANALRAAGEVGAAEEHYIAALRIDPMNAAAYFGLGELSIEAKNWEQAAETFTFLGRLLAKRLAAADADKDAIRTELIRAHVGAGEALREMREYARSREVFAKAASLEPANPKYLDLLLEACILVGDKTAAEEAFAAFVEANPENQKLEELRSRIDEMPEQDGRKTRKRKA